MSWGEPRREREHRMPHASRHEGVAPNELVPALVMPSPRYFTQMTALVTASALIAHGRRSDPWLRWPLFGSCSRRLLFPTSCTSSIASVPLLWR